MAKKTAKFGKVKSITKIEEGAVIQLDDFQITGTSHIDDSMYMVNFEIELNDDNKYSEYVIKPGMFRITPKDGLIALDVPEERYFETNTTKDLIKHFNVFKNKLDLIKKRNKLKRSVLLGSSPGTGKSALLRHFCRTIKSDPKVCCLKIDNDNVSFEGLTQMFMNVDKTAVDYVVLIIEDIGGTNLYERSNSVDSTLLNFLDGNSDVFTIPTLIVGTTNFLNELGSALIDRPGRFDIVMYVEPPQDNETFVIAEGLLGRELKEEEKTALSGKKFTPAYTVEAIDRHELYDIPISEAVAELEKQREKSQQKTHGTNSTRMGFLED